MSVSPHGTTAGMKFADLLASVDEEDQVLMEAHLERTYTEHFASQTGRRHRPSSLELVAKACEGPVHVYGAWGSKKDVFLGVVAPSPGAGTEWSIGIWSTEHEFKRGGNPTETISILRVMSIQPETQRPEVFLVNFMITRTQKQRLVFERIDRSRNLWVEMLMLLTELVHQERIEKRKKQHSRSPSPRHRSGSPDASGRARDRPGKSGKTAETGDG